MSRETTYNFAAGPAMLPAEVMKKAQDEFSAYQDSGSGLMELSHRGKYFKPVIERAEANVRELLGLSPADKSCAAPRTPEYYKKRPCVELVGDAAGIFADMLLKSST